MWQTYRHVLPEVKRQLNGWYLRAQHIPDAELRKQALDSIAYKRFHCEGGSIYALLSSKPRSGLIRLVVALQTISDFLDNLCDRSTSWDERDFRQLHQAMRDAVESDVGQGDYYAWREEKEDGGYLAALVTACQEEVRRLPNYDAVKPHVCRFVHLYTEMQTQKHLLPDLREGRLREWFLAEWQNVGPSEQRAYEILWNEFAAASGSTLGVFALFVLASYDELEADHVSNLCQAYFPWVCGLHILLDYFIDQEEDALGGDLNFVAAYTHPDMAKKRLLWFAQQAREQVQGLPAAAFHRWIVEGLLGLYLSNHKVRRQPEVLETARHLMGEAHWGTRFFYLNGRIYMGRLDQTQPTRST